MRPPTPIAGAAGLRGTSWGYFRPVQSFNIGKKGEYHERQMFSRAPRMRIGGFVSAFLPRGVADVGARPHDDDAGATRGTLSLSPGPHAGGGCAQRDAGRPGRSPSAPCRCRPWTAGEGPWRPCSQVPVGAPYCHNSGGAIVTHPAWGRVGSV